MLKQVSWPLWQGKSDGKYSLEFVKKALEVFGNPQSKIPHPIHIVGTNGKGSTCAFVESILKEENLKSHVYTSPNLVYLNERIKIAGSQIEDSTMLLGLEYIRSKLSEVNLDDKISFFEGLTILAFLEFAKTTADFSLIEAGLGGRLDATNVIDSKVCVLTGCSYDHTEVLGKSLKEIVKEKVSLNTTAPFVCSFQRYEEVYNYLPSNAVVYGRDYSVEVFEDGSFKYLSPNFDLKLKEPSLKGMHQYYNAATAIKVCEMLNVSKHAIAEGIEKAFWPARMQKLSLHGKEFYLDGGHNEDGVRAALAYFLKKHPDGDVICGFLSRKNLDSIVPQFKGVRNLHTISIHSTEKSRSAKDLAEEFEKGGMKVASINEYFYDALLNTGNKGVLILGSLYLAGECLEYLSQHYGKS